MAQSHLIYVAFKIFRTAIDNPNTFKCAKLRGHMTDLAKVMALHELLSSDSSVNYESGFLALGSRKILLEAEKLLLTKLRPMMIPLIEAWEFPDSLLVSAIGNSYGDIYE